MNHSTPFFILANPRSGSSLLRIICDCNSALAVPPESGFLVWWKAKYEQELPSKWKSPEFLDQFVTDVLSSKKFETWNVEHKELLDFIAEVQPATYSEAASLVYHYHARKRGKQPTYWGDKNNYYIKHLEELIGLYPHARFIHLVRDGRDVACSYKNLKQLTSGSDYFPNLTDNIGEIAAEWAENNDAIADFLQAEASANSLLVKYEDLIVSPEETSKTICEFLGVPFDKTMLEYDRLNRQNNLEPAATLDWKMNTLNKPDKTRIGRYARLLSKGEINTFNRRAAGTLERYGYV